MPSIFIPTKTILTAYKANPSQIVRDKEAEDYFVNTDNYQFLRKLSTAVRAGQLSVTYATTTVNATAIRTYLIDTAYGYNFSASDVVVTPDEARPSDATLTVSWTYTA